MLVGALRVATPERSGFSKRLCKIPQSSWASLRERNGFTCSEDNQW